MESNTPRLVRLILAAVVKSMNKMAHDHGAYVSTGGWIENVLRFGPRPVDRYICPRPRFALSRLFSSRCHS